MIWGNCGRTRETGDEEEYEEEGVLVSVCVGGVVRNKKDKKRR